MDEYSRILIEEYISGHRTKKAATLARLLRFYDMECEPGDADGLEIERLINIERNPELKAAMQDLDVALFS